jgi:cell division protease FtsH
MPNDEKRSRFPFDLGGGTNPSPGPGGRPRWRFSLGYVLIGVLLVLLISNPLRPSPTEVPFSQFLQLAESGAITEVEIGATDVIATQKLEDGEREITAAIPPNFDPTELSSELTAKGVEVTGGKPNWVTSLIGYVLPFLLIIGVYLFIFRRMAGGGAAGALNLGRNKVRIYDRKDLKTTFADVAGVDEAVQELHEIVDFLSNPKKYQRLGGRIPKGVLLLGPPGCGKTLLARAVAGEAKVPFFYMSGSEFVEMFVGLGAARVRELFQQAKEKAPCLVFLDELDTIGKSRGGALGGSMGSHDEREQTLNQLLVEMDGFDTSKGVIIMAATNRGDVLDPALLRPGRFDRQVVVDRPDLRGRERILQVHARGVALDKTVDLRLIAARTAGFTGADLANAVNEAALLAARREKDSVTMSELEEAIDRVVAGLERKSRVLSEKERVIVAHHEMGHALVALAVPTADPLHRVSIIPRGTAALGMTMQRPLEDRYLLTEPELKDRLAILLGGRTAEELSFKQISTGAQNDLQRATEISRAMVVEYGMSEAIGPLSYGLDGFRNADGRPLFPYERPEMSEEMHKKVDAEVFRLIEEAHDRARTILQDSGELLPKLSELLMAKEVMEGEELKAYVEGRRGLPPQSELDALVADRTPADEPPHEAPPPPPPGPVEIEEGVSRLSDPPPDLRG